MIKEFCFGIVKLKNVAHNFSLLKTFLWPSTTLRTEVRSSPHPEALWDLSLVYLFVFSLLMFFLLITFQLQNLACSSRLSHASFSWCFALRLCYRRLGVKTLIRCDQKKKKKPYPLQRALGAVSKDWSLVPNTHISLTNICNSSSRGLGVLF